MGKRGHRRWEGCRGPYARVGVNYHYPPKTRLSFCSPRVPFCFFPRCPTPPTRRQRASIPPLAFATLLRPLILHLLLYSSSYHRPPKIRVRYYLSPDRSRSATPANVLLPSPRPSSRPSDHYWSPHNLIAGILLKVSTARRLVYDFAN